MTQETIRLRPEEEFIAEYSNRIHAINDQIRNNDGTDRFEIGVLRGRGLATQAEFLRRYTESRAKVGSEYVWQGLRYIHDQLQVDGLSPNPLHVINHVLTYYEELASKGTVRHSLNTNEEAYIAIGRQAAYRQVRIEIYAQPASTFE